MITFVLNRHSPLPGQPGGVVAEAVVFSTGLAVLQWLTEPQAVETYPSEAAMRGQREQSGRSVFEPGGDR